MGCGTSRASAAAAPYAVDGKAGAAAAAAAGLTDAEKAVLGKYLIQKVRTPKLAGQLAPLTCPILDELLAHGLDIDAVDGGPLGWTAFHHACDRGELEKVRGPSDRPWVAATLRCSRRRR